MSNETLPSLTFAGAHRVPHLCYASDVKSTLTVDVRRQPGVSLRSMILRYVGRRVKWSDCIADNSLHSNIALKSSVAFNDTSLNPLWIVYANIYQNVAHGAMKAVHMAAALGFDAQLHAGYLLRASGIACRRPRLELTEDFLLPGIIDEVGDFAFVTVSNGANTRMARAAGATIAVERAIICWYAGAFLQSPSPLSSPNSYHPLPGSANTPFTASLPLSKPCSLRSSEPFARKSNRVRIPARKHVPRAGRISWRGPGRASRASITKIGEHIGVQHGTDCHCVSLVIYTMTNRRLDR